jgi:hypothetical protein
VPLELVFRSGTTTMTGAESVDGRKARALKFAGATGATAAGTARWNPAGKPFTIGAWCRPESASGVLMSLGGASHGFTLWVEEGFPCVAVRTAGQLSAVRGKEQLALNAWSHVAALLDSRGGLRLFLNGKVIADAKSGGIAAKPSDGFALGADPSSHVGPYNSDLPWRGLIEDARLYWGELDKDAFDDWTAN